MTLLMMTAGSDLMLFSIFLGRRQQTCRTYEMHLAAYCW